MNICEKQAFILVTIWEVVSKIMKKLNELPDDWNGFELKQLLADEFAETVAHFRMDKKRREDYERWMINHW